MKFKYLSLVGISMLMVFSNAQSQTIVKGAGSTFDEPAFTKWFSVYAGVDASVSFEYKANGSGAGQKALLAQSVDFGASDAPMSDESMSKAPGKVLHFPLFVGGEAIVYNLPGNPKIKLDGDTLANMFMGTITKWNDPKIAAINPGVNLPNQPVIPVHRSESSGTSFIFTDYLSQVSSTWANSIGKDSAPKWPVGLGGKGNDGIAEQIGQLTGTIGYVELAFALEKKMTYAEIKNAAGKYVSPTLDTISAALSTAKVPEDFRFSMVNASGDNSYPIASASWVLVYQSSGKPETKKLVSFLKWAITEGQSHSSQLNYAKLPESVQKRELALLDTVK